MIDDKVYENAFAELLVIFKNLEEELIKRIPDKFIKFIQYNANLDHKFEFDTSKPISEQKILPETKALLATIYREYLES